MSDPQQHRRKFDRKQFKRPHRRERDDNSESPARIRHPPHLKGREIGLFYSNLSKMRKQEEGYVPRPPKPLGSVLLSETRKRQIEDILQNTPHFLEDIANLPFKKKFSNLITGSIEERLESTPKITQKVTLDEKLHKEFKEKQSNLQYICMLAKRKRLPSYSKQEEILKLIDDNQVLVISGETGCGKTTQVAQFILDDYIQKDRGSLCNIICTQPRRISAISVAERVAEERAERLGVSIGYHIRLEKELPREAGGITFCTTGVVLRLMQSDPCLSSVSHIILDEIHERNVMSDFLIALLKQVLSKRSDLKLVLMSATLNSEKFSRYYDDCPHINIPGFTYPVKEYYLEDVLQRTGFVLNNYSNARRKRKDNHDEERLYHELIEPHVRKLEAEKTYSRHVCIQLRNPEIEETNLDLILALLINICEKEKDEGAILVFLTGYAEISKLNQLMEQSGKFPKNKSLVLPLHSRMPTVNQKEVFQRPSTGVRKIILSTNIAETSITIDDVVFVIDCGKIKMSNFNVETNETTLQPEWVSLANAAQRKGRAGRVQAGICFHLFSRAREMVLEQYQKPEILRVRLETTILNIKVLQLGKAEAFLNRLMDSPQPDAIALSLELLKRLNALDEDETLTPLGYHLAKLPMGPQMGKMILLGAIFSCLDPVLSVAASLDFKDAFQLPLGKEKEVGAKKRELADGCSSDHLLLYRALNQFENEDRYSVRQFCWNYFLSYYTLTQLQSMKGQFMEYLYEMDFVHTKDPKSAECNHNSHNLSLIKAVICAGLYPNVGVIRGPKFRKSVRTIQGEKAKLHPGSILSKDVNLGYRSSLCVYYVKIRSSANYVHDVTLIQPLPLIFFGDNYKYNDGEHPTISIGNDKVRVKCSRSTNEIIRKLRDRLNMFLEYKVSNPGIVNWQTDGEETAVLRAVIELITSEDTGDLDLEAYDDTD